MSCLVKPSSHCKPYSFMSYVVSPAECHFRPTALSLLCACFHISIKRFPSGATAKGHCSGEENQNLILKGEGQAAAITPVVTQCQLSSISLAFICWDHKLQAISGQSCMSSSHIKTLSDALQMSTPLVAYVQLVAKPCGCFCRSHRLQVMRVQSTEGQHSEIGLYLQHTDVHRVLEGVRKLQPLKPWQFKTSKQPWMHFPSACVCT